MDSKAAESLLKTVCQRRKTETRIMISCISFCRCFRYRRNTSAARGGCAGNRQSLCSSMNCIEYGIFFAEDDLFRKEKGGMQRCRTH